MSARTDGAGAQSMLPGLLQSLQLTPEAWAMSLSIAWRFMGLSLLAFGGVNAMLAEIQRVVVRELAWMDAETFAHLFAIAQAAPGPNLMILSLIGWQAAGLPGAIAATAGFCVPSGILVYGVLIIWDRFRQARWRRILEGAVAPVAVGLVVASGLHVSVIAADSSARAWVLVALTVVVQMLWRMHPLWLIAAGGLAGGLGLLG